MGWSSLTAEAASPVLQTKWQLWEEAKVTVFSGDICLAVSDKTLLYNLGYTPLSSWASLCLLPQTSRRTVLAHGCLFWKQSWKSLKIGGFCGDVCPLDLSQSPGCSCKDPLLWSL